MENTISKTSQNNNDDEKPPSNLAVLISPHLKQLSKKSPAIKKQFYPDKKECKFSKLAFIDPLLEDNFIKTKGLVHKYPNRVLIELTLTCASYCRFCTRRRMVSDLKKLKVTPKDIDRMVFYLTENPQINEVIFSGGDPLTAPFLLELALKKINKIPNIKIIRIHTRVPVSNPSLIKADFYQTLAKIKNKPIYLSIHFEHPDEITAKTKNIIQKLHQAGAILLSQTVFLKDINDDYETLYLLFTKLSELGIRPYYIYRCDPVRGIEHFIVPFDKELEIMTKLRSNLSGIACPTYVIDTPNGAGKIPAPLNYWQFNKNSFKDFNGKNILVR